MAKQTETTQVTEVTQPMNLEAAMNLLRTTDECLRYHDGGDGSKDFYITRDTVTRIVRKNGKRVKEIIENWIAFNIYNNAHHDINIADLGGVNWYLMDFDEDGNPVWDLPPKNNTEEETAVV